MIAYGLCRVHLARSSHGREADCNEAHFWSERILEVRLADNPLAACEELAWHDLVVQDFIVSDASLGREVHEHIFRKASRLRSHTGIQTQFVGRDNLLSLVAIGQGLTLISEAMAVTRFPGTAYRPISGETLLFSTVWSPRNDTPALRSRLSMARKAAQILTLSTSSSSLLAEPSQTLDPLP
ncbi:hypothetical protein [Thioclava sp. GXIMD4215]|uniref:hypothetical protein n=1 Tax=Thioclava sp. GXIMD4215 TaxID=3131928 RepID=UPI00324ED73D